MMLLYVDGLDKTGKTTFAKEWHQRFNAAHITIPYPKIPYPAVVPVDYQDVINILNIGDFFLGTSVAILEAYRAAGVDFVVNRSYVSELVYAPLLGRTPETHKAKWWASQLPEDAHFIYFTVTYAEYIDRCAHSPDKDQVTFTEPQWLEKDEEYLKRYPQLGLGLGDRTLVVSGEMATEDQIRMVQSWLQGTHNTRQSRHSKDVSMSP